MAPVIQHQAGKINLATLAFSTAMMGMAALLTMPEKIEQSETKNIESLQTEVMRLISAQMACYDDERRWCTQAELSPYTSETGVTVGGGVMTFVLNGNGRDLDLTFDAGNTEYARVLARKFGNTSVVSGTYVTASVPPPTSSRKFDEQIMKWGDTAGIGRNQMNIQLDMNDNDLDRIRTLSGGDITLDDANIDEFIVNTAIVSDGLQLGNNAITFGENTMGVNAALIIYNSDVGVQGDITSVTGSVEGVNQFRATSAEIGQLAVDTALGQNMTGESLSYNNGVLNIANTADAKATSGDITAVRSDVTQTQKFVTDTANADKSTLTRMEGRIVSGTSLTVKNGSAELVEAESSQIGNGMSEELTVSGEVSSQGELRANNISVEYDIDGREFYADDLFTAINSVNQNYENLAFQDLQHLENTGLTNNNQSSINSNNDENRVHSESISDHTAAINNNLAEIESNASSHETNRVAVKQNASTIANNESLIASNAKDIANNLSNINNNTSAANRNSADIDSNSSLIENNAADIARNQSLTQSNSDAASTNQVNVQTNENSIATNRSDILTNSSRAASNLSQIQNNAGKILENQKKTNANTSAIESNDRDIASNQSAIQANTIDIATNSDETKNNADEIASNRGVVLNNTDQISTHKASIASNLDRIDFNTAQSTQNKSDSAGNAVRMAANTTAIQNNGSDIQTNQHGANNNKADVANNSRKIGSNATALDINKRNATSNNNLITQNQINIANNLNKVNDNSAAIENNRKSNQNNVNAAASNQQEINNNSGQISTNTSSHVANSDLINRNSNDAQNNKTRSINNQNSSASNAVEISRQNSRIKNNDSAITNNRNAANATASSLASHANALNAHENRILENSRDVGRNKGNSKDNRNRINTNNSDIAYHRDVRLVQNKNAIDANAAASTDNDAEINSVGSTVSGNTSRIEQVDTKNRHQDGQIANNSSGISTNQAEIDDIESTLVSVSSDVDSHNSRINDNAAGISAASTKVASLTDDLNRCVNISKYCIPESPSISSASCPDCNKEAESDYIQADATAYISGCRQGCTYSWSVPSNVSIKSACVSNRKISAGGALSSRCRIYKRGIPKQSEVSGQLTLSVQNNVYPSKSTSKIFSFRFKNITPDPPPVPTISDFECDKCIAFKEDNSSFSATVSGSISKCRDGCNYSWESTTGNIRLNSCSAGSVPAGRTATPSCGISATVGTGNKVTGSVRLRVSASSDASKNNSASQSVSWENRKGYTLGDNTGTNCTSNTSGSACGAGSPFTSTTREYVVITRALVEGQSISNWGSTGCPDCTVGTSYYGAQCQVDGQSRSPTIQRGNGWVRIRYTAQGGSDGHCSVTARFAISGQGQSTVETQNINLVWSH